MNMTSQFHGQTNSEIWDRQVQGHGWKKSQKHFQISILYQTQILLLLKSPKSNIQNSTIRWICRENNSQEILRNILKVIMESRLSIIQYSNRKISAEQIQSVVTRIFNEIMSKFADVNGENTVQSEFYCNNILYGTYNGINTNINILVLVI